MCTRTTYAVKWYPAGKILHLLRRRTVIIYHSSHKGQSPSEHLSFHAPRISLHKTRSMVHGRRRTGVAAYRRCAEMVGLGWEGPCVRGNHSLRRGLVIVVLGCYSSRCWECWLSQCRALVFKALGNIAWVTLVVKALGERRLGHTLEWSSPSPSRSNSDQSSVPLPNTDDRPVRGAISRETYRRFRQSRLGIMWRGIFSRRRRNRVA